MYRKKYIALIGVTALFFTACSMQSINVLAVKVKGLKPSVNVKIDNKDKQNTMDKKSKLKSKSNLVVMNSQSIKDNITAINMKRMYILGAIPKCFLEKSRDEYIEVCPFEKVIRVKDYVLSVIFIFDVEYKWNNGLYRPNRIIGKAKEISVWQKNTRHTNIRIKHAVERTDVNDAENEISYKYLIRVDKYAGRKINSYVDDGMFNVDFNDMLTYEQYKALEW